MPCSSCPWVRDPASDHSSTRGQAMFILFMTCPHFIFFPLPGDGDFMQKVCRKEGNLAQTDFSFLNGWDRGAKKAEMLHKAHFPPMSLRYRHPRGRGDAWSGSGQFFGRLLLLTDLHQLHSAFLHPANPNLPSPCRAVRSLLLGFGHVQPAHPRTGWLPHRLPHLCSCTSCAGSTSVNAWRRRRCSGALPAPLPHGHQQAWLEGKSSAWDAPAKPSSGDTQLLGTVGFVLACFQEQVSMTQVLALCSCLTLCSGHL